MTKPLDRIAFEYSAGIGSKADFEAWDESELRKEEPHSDACEMFNLAEEEAEKQSIRLATEILVFKLASETGEKWRNSYYKNTVKSLLMRK